MVVNFSPSINIIRDADKDFYYVPTANSKDIFNQIAQQFNSGVHSFNIVGSYGTGKSSFLLALSKHLNGEGDFFSPVNGQFNKCKSFNFLNLVGEYSSIIEAFATSLKVEATPKAIINRLNSLHKQLKKDKTCLIIAVDEFGKFLEYAVKNNPDEELYFIQQLAEFVNDKETNILYLSTLHQNFDAYSAGLSKSQRAEWEKVKGRIKELTFNEPIEQLLHLVTEFLETKFSAKKKPRFNSNFIESIQESGAFNLLNKIDKGFVQSLYPFDLLSSMVITRALQQYGQNERSLFHFLGTNEKFGLYDYDDEKNPYFNLSCVYDYLYYNYYGVLTSKYNPAYFRWSLLRNSLDRIDIELTTHIQEAKSIVKTIGLLNILGGDAAKISDNLLLQYGSIALGIKETQSILNLLLKKKIIRYQKYNERYKLFEGTDFDIDKLIEDEKRVIDPIVDVIAELEGKLNIDIVLAKAVTYNFGTPRYFEFQTSVEPIIRFQSTERGIDGMVNLILRENAPIKKIKEVVGEPILYGVYQNVAYIKELIQDIKVTDKAIKKASSDAVAVKELKERRTHHVDALNNAINEELFNTDSKVKWYFNGESVKIKNQREFNKELSHICNILFDKVPVFKNELMNRHKPSTIINTSRKLYFKQLLENHSKPFLGFPQDKHPAEKTIYHALLVNTGIHQVDKSQTHASFYEPQDITFSHIWKASQDFLQSAKIGKRSVTEFIDVLRKKPFGLKDGFIEFWIGTFLFIHREDFALFNEAYIPKISSEVLELLFRDAHKYQIKTFSVEGVRLELFNKYRQLIQAKSIDNVTSSSFKETATPFLMFHKQLPTYSKKTERLSKETLTFREVISKAKELEKTFFEDLPAAYGLTLNNLNQSSSNLENFVTQIQDSIRELRLSFSELINRIEAGMLDILGVGNLEFEVYVETIRNRYKNLKNHLLLPHQKVFYNRILSQIEDKENWIKNVIHAVIGKRLEDISDNDEAIIYDKLKDVFQELDDLIALSKTTKNKEEEIIRIKLTEENQKPLSKNIVITKKQQREVSQLEKEIGKILSKSKKINQAVLAKLLKKYL